MSSAGIARLPSDDELTASYRLGEPPNPLLIDKKFTSEVQGADRMEAQ